jgi:hypothetical protein
MQEKSGKNGGKKTLPIIRKAAPVLQKTTYPFGCSTALALFLPTTLL